MIIASRLLVRVARGLERERGGVDAVALARRAWAVVEDVSEVAAAATADDLGAAHQETIVGAQLDGLRDGGLGEARPAGPRLELRVRREEHRAACRAAVIAGILVVDVLARERRLGTRPAKNVV